MKKQTMFFRMVTGSIVRRRSRMLVALLAVAVGATVLFGLVTIYYDVPNQMGREFRSYGANMLLVPDGESPRITQADLDRVKDILSEEDVVGLAPYRYENVQINEQPYMAAGTDLVMAQSASPYYYVTGDWPQKSGEVMIGQEIAETTNLSQGKSFTLYGTDESGEKVTQQFEISGIVQTGGAEEAFVFLSLEDLAAMLGGGGFYDVVECSIAAEQEALNRMIADIDEEVEDVTPRLVRRITESEDEVLSSLQSLVYLVTIVVLLLTMISVATTMMAVVEERRSEIGLKKALGASNKSVMAEFLGEGVTLGLLGSILGIVLGYAFAYAVSVSVFARAVSFRPALIPVTLLASILITAVACLIPVRRAIDVDPVIVLRGE